MSLDLFSIAFKNIFLALLPGGGVAIAPSGSAADCWVNKSTLTLLLLLQHFVTNANHLSCRRWIARALWHANPHHFYDNLFTVHQAVNCNKDHNIHSPRYWVRWSCIYTVTILKRCCVRLYTARPSVCPIGACRARQQQSAWLQSRAAAGDAHRPLHSLWHAGRVNFGSSARRFSTYCLYVFTAVVWEMTTGWQPWCIRKLTTVWSRQCDWRQVTYWSIHGLNKISLRHFWRATLLGLHEIMHDNEMYIHRESKNKTLSCCP